MKKASGVLICRRFGTSRFGRQVKLTYQQARVGHHEYLKRLKHPTEVHDIDPALLPYRERVHRLFTSSLGIGTCRVNAFTHPLTHQCYKPLYASSKSIQAPARRLLQPSNGFTHGGDSETPKIVSPPAVPSFRGTLASYDFRPFGTITAEHRDILSMDVDMLILPLTPNCMPHSGIGLEALERGGSELVNEVLRQAKVLLERRRVKKLKQNQQSAKVHDKERGSSSTEDFEQLQCGDSFEVPSFGAAASPTLLFVVLPYFYVLVAETTPIVAAQLLRHAVQTAFTRAGASWNPQEKPPLSAALPPLGAGRVHGYQRGLVLPILLTEAIETLLQLVKVTPHYAIKALHLVGSRKQDAEAIADLLHETAQRWLSDYCVNSAERYWTKRTKRLLTIPSSIVRQSSTFEKLSFVKRLPRRLRPYSRLPKIERMRRLHHRWRRYPVSRGPPLQVYNTTGAPVPRRQGHIMQRRVAFDAQESVGFEHSRKLRQWRIRWDGHLEGNTRVL